MRRLSFCAFISAAFISSSCTSSNETSLFRSNDIEAGALCAGGGKQLSFGIDKNGNGDLDEAEVGSSTYVCNGAQGAGGSDAKALVTATMVADVADCPTGGTLFQAGIDDDGDGVLDTPDELDSTVKICNGATGATGAQGTQGDPGIQGPQGETGATGTAGENGYNSLIDTRTEAVGMNCPAGGVRIDVGIDNGDGGGTARDNILQATEIDKTQYLCQMYDPVFNTPSASAADQVAINMGSESPMMVAWDGSNYFFATGTDQNGGRLVKMDTSFNEVAALTGVSFRSITTQADGVPPLLATVQLDSTVYLVDSMTGIMSANATIAPMYAFDAQLTWDAVNNEWLGRNVDTYSRYDTSFTRIDTFSGPVVNGWPLTVLALKGNIVLYSPGNKTLEVYTREGVKIEEVKLTDGPASCFGMSVANGKLWLSDGSTSLFKSYDVLN